MLLWPEDVPRENGRWWARLSGAAIGLSLVWLVPLAGSAFYKAITTPVRGFPFYFAIVLFVALIALGAAYCVFRDRKIWVRFGFLSCRF